MKKLVLLFCLVAVFAFGSPAQSSDAALRRVMAQDAWDRDANGKLTEMTAAEHLARAEVYSSNRLFPQAREHWKQVFDRFPNDPGIPKALFGTARSYMWERQYDTAVKWFDRLTKDFLFTKDGREGLAFKGASLVRLGKNADAARVYEQYVTAFPDGERIESAHLNIIDAYREAGEFQKAEDWVDRTVQRFRGKPTEVNALHARVRMEIYRGNWADAAAAADTLLAGRSFAGSMTSADEIRYLKALALEKAGRTGESRPVLASIGSGSYFGELAANKLGGAGVKATAAVSSAEFPAAFRSELVRYAKPRGVDPRFVLAIMKQESSFRPAAKSPSAARGLLQLVYDTALKYNKTAGFPSLQPDDLYTPSTNIAVGSAYMADLKDQFDGLYEAIAASYNGGEDNAARWLNRSKPKDPGVFVAEVGFAETKNYVLKVMNNYRVYRQLYTEDLVRR
jgi:soluble lytic murein transglycosylase